MTFGAGKQPGRERSEARRILSGQWSGYDQSTRLHQLTVGSEDTEDEGANQVHSFLQSHGQICGEGR